MKLMVKKVLPLSLVDSQYFKEFVALLDPRYVVPSRKTLTSRLHEKHKEMKKKLKEDIESCQDVAITHDSWTSINTQSFSTVTSHFISAKDWELKSTVIETAKVEGSHTSLNISAYLLDMHKRWMPNITPTGVSDNAANEKKAFELSEWLRFGCYGHRINLVVKKALELPEVSKLIAKGRKLVTFFHSSTSMNDVLIAKQKLILEPDAQNHKLIQDVSTRWNSTYLMLERLAEQTPAIFATVTDPSVSHNKKLSCVKNLVYSFEEQASIDRLISVLKPFYIGTTILCADKVPTLSKVIPVLLKIGKLLKVCKDDTPMIKKVKGIIQHELDSRVENIDDRLTMLALILNPLTKELNFLSPDEQSRAKEMLINEVKELTFVPVKIKEEREGTQGDPPLPQLPQTHELPAKQFNTEVKDGVCVSVKRIKQETCDDWLSDIIFTGESVANPTEAASKEVNRYLSIPVTSDKEDILKWWKVHCDVLPHISQLARKYLSIPASSVPSERVFSFTGNLVNKKRSRISAENIDMLVFLNKNSDLYW